MKYPEQVNAEKGRENSDMYLVKEEQLASDSEREVIYLDEGFWGRGGCRSRPV